MCLGNGARARAGEKGIVQLRWWDHAAERFRYAIGYTGEDGIDVGVWYEVQDGKLMRAADQSDPAAEIIAEIKSEQVQVRAIMKLAIEEAERINAEATKMVAGGAAE